MSPAAIDVRRGLHGDCACGADPADPCAVCASGRLRPRRGCAPAPSEPPKPSLLRRAVNLTKAVARDVAAGMPRRTEEEQARILAICRECDQFRPSDQTCARCGCPIARKSPLARERCPLGRW